jgi:peptidyl-prolyl cis-trans isomerase C
MNRKPENPLTILSLILTIALLAACSEEPAETAGPVTDAAAPAEVAAIQEPDDVIATVGDQFITFSQINTMLNSSAIVGLSIPALGTPQRDTVRITLLDKLISANLIYLDARQKGLDKDPVYLADLEHFSDSMLAMLYQTKYLSSGITISDEDIDTFLKANFAEGTELTDDIRRIIEATLRKQRFEAQTATLRIRLREGVDIRLVDEEMDPAEDAVRDDSATLATIDGKPLTWGEMKMALRAPQYSGSADARREALNKQIDIRIMTRKAREAGLDKDPAYLARMAEFRKTRLINHHRLGLVNDIEPTDAEIDAYYEANRDAIADPEVRKVQMVVLKTQEEADAVKKRIEAEEITLFEAARDHSITPTAKQDLGEVGWVERGTALPALDEAIFSLGPGELGGPVETPAGWHIVSVTDIREAQHQDIKSHETRNLTRRKLIHDKLDEYVVNLRKQGLYPIEVREDVMVRLAQQEADLVGQLAEQAAQPGSITEQRIEELREQMAQPK